MRCPLRTLALPIEEDICLKKDCSWYDRSKYQCAVISVVDELDELRKSINQVKY
jgi:hypothetical protein